MLLTAGSDLGVFGYLINPIFPLDRGERFQWN